MDDQGGMGIDMQTPREASSIKLPPTFRLMTLDGGKTLDIELPIPRSYQTYSHVKLRSIIEPVPSNIGMHCHKIGMDSERFGIN
jgi:hypothetical protein